MGKPRDPIREDPSMMGHTGTTPDGYDQGEAKNQKVKEQAGHEKNRDQWQSPAGLKQFHNKT
ncbi:MAG: hypothetical protein V3R11_01405 [Nitrospirales bacterium]